MTCTPVCFGSRQKAISKKPRVPKFSLFKLHSYKTGPQTRVGFFFSKNLSRLRCDKFLEKNLKRFLPGGTIPSSLSNDNELGIGLEFRHSRGLTLRGSVIAIR